MEQTIYIDRTLGDSVQISMTEFVFYLTLIEELLDELEKDVEISPNVIPEPPSGYLVFEPDFEDYLDEFDRYEIEQMRIKFGLSESRTVVTRGSDWDGKK